METKSFLIKRNVPQTVPISKCPQVSVFFYGRSRLRIKVPLVVALIRMPQLAELINVSSYNNKYVILADLTDVELEKFGGFVTNGEIVGSESEIENILKVLYYCNPEDEFTVKSVGSSSKKVITANVAVKTAFETVQKVQDGEVKNSVKDNHESNHLCCPKCGKQCSTSSVYLNHVTTHYRKKILYDLGKDYWRTDGYVFQCLICGNYTKTKNGISTHLGSVHKIAGQISQNSCEDSDSSNDTKPFVISGIKSLRSPSTPGPNDPAPPTPSYDVKSEVLVMPWFLLLIFDVQANVSKVSRLIIAPPTPSDDVKSQVLMIVLLICFL